MDKKQLRRTMKQLRAALPPAEREESALCVLERLRQRPEFRKAGTLFCYASVGAELPTAAIAGAHPRVAFPKVLADGVMRFYIGGVLQPGFRGIPEPVGGQEVWPQEGDLMLLPGLAFGVKDASRLGYGGGYYDRYLAACPVRPLCCGIGYQEQMRQEPIPQEPHDQRMDLLISPKDVICFKEP